MLIEGPGSLSRLVNREALLDEAAIEAITVRLATALPAKVRRASTGR